MLLAWRQGGRGSGTGQHCSGEGEQEPWAHWVMADERVAAPVALFPRMSLLVPPPLQLPVAALC